MTVTIEKLPDAPILIQTYASDYSLRAEGASAVDMSIQALDNQSQPVMFIMDMSEARLNFDDIVLGASLATRQRAFFKHPMLLGAIVVTRDSMSALAARGLNAPGFDQSNVRVAGSRDAALDYARRATQGAA